MADDLGLGAILDGENTKLSRTALLSDGEQSHKGSGYMQYTIVKCFNRDTCLDREVRGDGQLSLMKSEKALEEETLSSSLDLEKGANVLKEIMGKITERLNSKMNFGK